MRKRKPSVGSLIVYQFIRLCSFAIGQHLLSYAECDKHCNDTQFSSGSSQFSFQFDEPGFYDHIAVKSHYLSPEGTPLPSWNILLIFRVVVIAYL